jgi:hypothetical protein
MTRPGLRFSARAAHPKKNGGVRLSPRSDEPHDISGESREEHRRRIDRERKRKQRRRDDAGDLALDPMSLTNRAAEAALALGLLTERDMEDKQARTTAVQDLVNELLIDSLTELLSDGRLMSRRDPQRGRGMTG